MIFQEYLKSISNLLLLTSLSECRVLKAMLENHQIKRKGNLHDKVRLQRKMKCQWVILQTLKNSWEEAVRVLSQGQSPNSRKPSKTKQSWLLSSSPTPSRETLLETWKRLLLAIIRPLRTCSKKLNMWKKWTSSKSLPDSRTTLKSSLKSLISTIWLKMLLLISSVFCLDNSFWRRGNEYNSL